MKLYNANLSPNCLRVRAVANEFGLELEIIELDLRAREHKSDAYLAMNPNGKVPVLADDGLVLWESRAINAYLASKDPRRRLYPEEIATRAAVDQWSYWQAIHLGPAMQRVSFERVLKRKFGMGEPDESVVETSVAETSTLLKVLDASLGDREWVAGSLSLADFALATTFVWREAAGILLEETPNVAAWIARMEARTSWQAATAPIMAYQVRIDE